MAFNPSEGSFIEVSRSAARESTRKVSVVTFREESGGNTTGDFSCPCAHIPENTVRNSKKLGKKTAADLKFDNEYYFCSNPKLAQN